MPNRQYTPSTGNVFADLNLPHADDLLAKADRRLKSSPKFNDGG
ncbi:MAG: hypothetical protein ACR2I2_04120 [Bryobacteraceae bacterium]